MDEELNIDNLVVPAILYTYIGTPNQKVFRSNSPSDLYTEMIYKSDQIYTESYSFSALPRNIFRERMLSVIKQNIITSFNLTNNCILNTELLNTEAIRDMIPYDITSSKLSRKSSELFLTRETLDKLLNYVDRYAHNICISVGHNIDLKYFIEQSFWVASMLYNVCLNFIDCEKDIINLNIFVANLTQTLPLDFMTLYREYTEIYMNHIVNTSNNNDVQYDAVEYQ